MTILMPVLWIILLFIFSLYIVTSTTLLLSAKFKKNAKGNLILNPDSWHFKLSHPILTRRYSSLAIRKYKDDFKNIIPSSICGYCANFSFMLYIGWPTLILWSVLKTLVYTPFMILFGYYPIADMKSMIWHDNPFAVEVGEISLPKIKEYKIFPAYIALPTAYLAGWLYYPSVVFKVSVWVLFVAAVIATILALVWFKETDQEQVSLAKEWLSAKKNRICWKLELASAEKIQGHPLDKN